MPLTSIHKAILAAVECDPRSARRISIDATENESTIRNLKRGVDAQISTVNKIADSLGLEFYLAPKDDDRLALNELANVINAHMQASKDRFLQEGRDRASKQIYQPDPQTAYRVLKFQTGEATDGNIAVKIDFEGLGKLVSLLSPEQAKALSARLAHRALEIEDKSQLSQPAQQPYHSAKAEEKK